ncbi:MAG: YqaJ viral recombinase family protein [Treponema sp.]|nr:YqaJ viral recombinase family protein [Treponema sp.]
MMYQNIVDNTPHISTVGMEYEAWRKKRMESLGGSDAGAVMGMNTFASPLTLYLRKKGLVAAPETSRAAKRGKILEPVIRQLTGEDFPQLVIEPVPFMFFHPLYPFISANIDGVVYAHEVVHVRGEDIVGIGGHEIKSAKTGYGWGEDEIPDNYYCQVQHYMAVLGLPWFMVSVYILDGEEIRHYIIRRNEEFVDKLIAAEKDFWETYIVPGVMPAATGIENEDDMITGMFAGTRGTIRLGDAERELCAEHVRLNAAKKDIENHMKAIAVTVKEAIIQNAGDNLVEKKASAVAGPYSVSWSFFETRRVDTDALKKAGLYDQYAKATETDRFTITEKKGA